MKKQLLAITSGIAFGAAGLWCQTTTMQAGGQTFTQTITFTSAETSFGGRGAQAGITGRPFSGTEERSTVQTLGDGTQIASHDSNLIYRDPMGRTRMERTVQGKTIVTIQDPVARFNARLDQEAKTAMKNPMPAEFRVLPDDQVADAKAQAAFAAGQQAGQAAAQAKQAAAQATTTISDAAGNVTTTRLRGATEDLGVENVSGIPAVHTRNTLTIAAGQIGNNRDIKVVNDRWYSEDLQMVVKTVNSDPRFGETTYELKNIVRSDPDPTLFVIPSDYTTTEGRGARGGSPGVLVKQQ